jgi:hypothetical protein
MFPAGRAGEGPGVDVAVFVISLVSSLVTAAVVIGLFVWAARKDGEYDEATQRRLGIRRRTRL